VNSSRVGPEGANANGYVVHFDSLSISMKGLRHATCDDRPRLCGVRRIQSRSGLRSRAGHERGIARRSGVLRSFRKWGYRGRARSKWRGRRIDRKYQLGSRARSIQLVRFRLNRRHDVRVGIDERGIGDAVRATRVAKRSHPLIRAPSPVCSRHEAWRSRPRAPMNLRVWQCRRRIRL
jgi:hypothetical protein